MSEAREVLDLDVLFVGAGPASLAGAYHLGKLIEAHNDALSAEASSDAIDLAIGVLEKGAEVKSHALSGAVVDPRALEELMPDSWQDAPFEAEVADEKFWWMTGKRAVSIKPLPPPLRNHGKYVASLGKLTTWLAEQVEALEIDVFCEFPAMEPLVEEDENGAARVIGVRTGDRGLDHEDKPKSNHEPGVDIHARVTVLGEGVRGTVTKQLDERFALSEGQNPMTYAIGIKEIWEVPEGRMAAGDIVHSAGWPLGEIFGGGFIYGMADNLIIVGLVAGLDYKNPHFDPHTAFQRYKTHPEVRELLAGGTMRFYGAKAIPEGGWWSMPRPHGPGFMLIGDAGGFLNSQKLKGIHLGMKSGMLAAETIFEGLVAGDLGPDALARYRQRIDTSWIKEELFSVRNFHQAFDRGQVAGFFQAGIGMITGGRGWGLFDRLQTHAGHEQMIKLDSPAGRALTKPETVAFDDRLTFDKLADVYNSGAAHEENQPVHLRVADPEHCVTVCAREYDSPCQRFCPANVYEIVDDAAHVSGKRLQINASNCVHCKTCDIMDPYQIITWVPPEGGGGPSYGKM